jgi:hypothetical protein
MQGAVSDLRVYSLQHVCYVQHAVPDAARAVPNAADSMLVDNVGIVFPCLLLYL